MEENKNNVGTQPEEDFNIQEILFRYLIHWPWFVGSVLFCVACAFGYLKLATPIYQVSATVMIKDDKKGGGSSMTSELEKMGLAGMVTSTNGVDNEIEVLKSSHWRTKSSINLTYMLPTATKMNSLRKNYIVRHPSW